MERPDRTDRAPPPQNPTTTAAAATTTASSSSGPRGLPENPAPGRRPVPGSAATSNGTTPPPPPPIPTGTNAPPNGNLSVSRALTPAQVMSLARDAMRTALESEGQAAEASTAGTGLKSGVTVDLSRKNIQKLPEEVVDIVKDELERLALSHNQLSALPTRFSECTSLRYLNIRGNLIKEFPMTLCDLTSLEILDLGRNQLRSLPNEISKLTCLKVLSVPKNHIRELPLCLADMVSLQVLKFEGNPISFPPKDALQLQASSPPNDRETEVTEVAVTAHIKRFMRHFALNGKIEAEGTGDDSSETAETPRFPLKRAASGRFPIKVNGPDDMRSPNPGARAPPIPSRSHYRGLSQQNAAIRRPGVMPLTIGNVNERLRSNSESLLRPDRSDGRNRRMGIVPKKTTELDTLEEAEPNNRFSHYRGLSHGSAMQENPPSSKSPATPTDSLLQRPIYVRRLSVLPERRRESKVYDPVIEAAKGILYSVFQIHPMIQMLMTLTNDGPAKRSSLEIVFYNTNSHVEELEQEIQKYETAILEEDDYATRDNQNVHRACQTLVSAYGHICTLLADNIDTFVNNGDARYIRSLLMLLYNSIMELRVTLCSVSSHSGRSMAQMQHENNNDTIKPYSQHSQMSSVTMDRNGQQRSRQGSMRHSPANSRSSQDHQGAYMSGPRRPNAYMPNEQQMSQMAPPGPVYSTPEDDILFERILISLQKSAEIVLQVLPNFNVQVTGRLRTATQQRAPEGALRDLKALINVCNDTVQQSEILRGQIFSLKRKDPSVRTQVGFGVMCRNFFSSWASTAVMVKELTKRLPLPPDTRVRLRPIQQLVKDTSNLIVQSPWQHLIRAPGPPGTYTNGTISPSNVPITPQSAALGPAMQATVPVTPQSASFARAFHGNVFDRADALIANHGVSMSRSGPMSRGHSNLSSLSSISSLSSDGAPTPPSNY